MLVRRLLAGAVTGEIFSVLGELPGPDATTQAGPEAVPPSGKC